MVQTDRRIAALPAKADRENDRWLPLWLHLKDTEQVLLWLFFQWLPPAQRRVMLPDVEEDRARATLSLLALLHDLGKATPVFVSHIARTGHMPEILERMEQAGYPAYWPPNYEVTHAAAGEVLLCRAGVPEGFASVVGAHHGKPQNEQFSSDIIWTNGAHCIVGRPADGDAWVRAQEGLLRWARSEVGLAPQDVPRLSQASQALLCALLIMADWIASNTCYFPLLSIDDDGASVDAASRARRALNRLALPPCWQSEADASWAQGIYDLRFGSGEMPFVPYPAQSRVADVAARMTSPGMMILEAPMGAGKTEAALAAAELMAATAGSGGVFFALPTQATANALFPRLMGWALRQSEDTVNTIRLCHRMAMLNPDYRDLLQGSPGDVMVGEESGLEVHSFFQGRKTGLLSSFVVATVDQLLMAALRRKHVMLRQLGLAGKVVVIDEVHAYDAYMSRYLRRALRWLGEWGTPVILLSATLPAATRSNLMDAYLGPRNADKGAPWRTSAEYPLLTWSEGGRVFQEKLPSGEQDKEVRLETIGDEARLERLRDALSEGGCAGVICNTVARAQAFAAEVEQAIPDAEVLVFHARFVMPQRAAIEQDVLGKLGRTGQRPRKLVLVGSQVLEQSLDIDLDLLITDLCPMDLLLQRIGRLHRHSRPRPGKLQRPQCWIAACEDEVLQGQRIYEEYLLLRTRQLLPEKLTLPRDIAPLVQAVYDDTRTGDEDPPRWREARERMRFEISKQEESAGAYCLREPMRVSRFKQSTLHGLLDASEGSDDIRAEAGVRGGEPSIEVLLLRLGEEGRAHTLFGRQTFPLDREPAASEAVQIARQRLRLPFALCTRWKIGGTIAELEGRTELAAPEWGRSPWLGGELLLLLDERGETTLNGYRLRYDQRSGLLCERQEEVTEG